MAKLTIGQKANRALKLLIGMQQAEVIDALKPRGFTAFDLDEGWEFLRALARTRLGPKFAFVPGQLAPLNAFEDHWFPVSRLTLERRYPQAAEYMFSNLPQTGGTEIIISVQLFIERLAALGSGQSPVGEDGVEARKLLTQRGLTPDFVAEIQKILEQVGAFNDGHVAGPTEREAAEEALWGWYLEWSGIVRLCITDRRLLRSLGFLKPTRTSKDAEDFVEVDVAAGNVTANAQLGAAAPAPQLTEGVPANTLAITPVVA